MKILIFGKNGQVGGELCSILQQDSAEFLACDRDDVDLENPEQIKSKIESYKPDVIINAAAYTAVDKAEQEPEKAKSINADAVLVMANSAKQIDALLVHYSTDYIFDGTKKEPYTEEDEPNPLSVYGKTKLEGEENIRASGCRHLIFRTSWVYSKNGHNFVNTILKLAKDRTEIKVVNDQIGCPTSAEFIAKNTLKCINIVQKDKTKLGTYNLTCKEAISWYDFAVKIVQDAWDRGDKLKLKAENIVPVSTEEYGQTGARRPMNSVFDKSKAFNLFKINSQKLWEKLSFKCFENEKGMLLPLELCKNIRNSDLPFKAKRFYSIVAPENSRNIVRGMHAHYNLEQVLIVIKGSFELHLEDTFGNKEMVLMNKSNFGIHIKKGIVWRELKELSTDCVIIVFASDHYAESDYIRSYKKFNEIKRRYE